MKIICKIFWFIGLFWHSLNAEVITDGSLGAKVSLQGEEYVIGAELGIQQGNNLFHSFEKFNLRTGETAIFSGSNQIQNIVARVTGGQSFISGTIRNAIPDANLYLANAQGFVIENNAKLDVQGSFYLTTASDIIFTDDQAWSTTADTDKMILSSAPPAAFGFLDVPQSIEISNTQLDTPAGKVLSFSSGNIFINNTRLKATSGSLSLLAIRRGDHVKPIIPIQGISELGQINISNKSTLDIGRDGGGLISIHSNELTLDNSSIFVNTSVIGQSSTLFINTGNLLLNNATLDSRTYGLGQGGLIIVQVKNDANLIDSDILTTGTKKEPEVVGDAGNIHFTANNLNLSNTSITTKTYGGGAGGDINIFIRKNLYIASPKPTSLDIFASTIQASTEGEGNAGRIYIEAGNLTLTGLGTSIDNNSKGGGNGGSIQLHIRDILNLSDGALISADSEFSGKAGNISINTTKLLLQNSKISTTANEADGGNIILNVRNQFNLTNSAVSASISNAEGTGNGGNLIISNPCLFNLLDSQLRTSARFGNGGIILAISGLGLNLLGESKIDASSEFGTDGSVQIDEALSVDRSTLPTNFLDASVKIKQRCIARTDDNVSHFGVKQRATVPNAPDDFQSYIPLLYK